MGQRSRADKMKNPNHQYSLVRKIYGHPSAPFGREDAKEKFVKEFCVPHAITGLNCQEQLTKE